MTKKQQRNNSTIIITIIVVFAITVIASLIVSLLQRESSDQLKKDALWREQHSCLRGVSYTDASSGDTKWVELIDGYCVAKDKYKLGTCSRVDSYGTCYDSNGNVKGKSDLIKL